MFELRVYVGANPPIITQHVNPMVPLSIIAGNIARFDGFDFTRAECWYNGIRQWELIID